VSYSKLPVQLEMVSVYRGPPKDSASLLYDEMVNAMNSTAANWTFPRQWRAYWLKCSYRGSTLELSKPLPRSVSSCLVSYNRQSAPELDVLHQGRRPQAGGARLASRWGTCHWPPGVKSGVLGGARLLLGYILRACRG
jgi:hypothetical protein